MNLRVLIIDDDDVARQLLCSVLQAAGHETLDLPTPIGATRLIQDQRVEVVVIDILMPALNGDRLARLLRGNPQFRNLGVVLVTGDTNADLDSIAQRVGARAVVNRAELREKIASAVERAVRVRPRDPTLPPERR